MKRTNKKGFTLIELLTVIAILAVILLIAAPVILGVLDKARKNTFKNQVLLYVEGLKQQTALASMGSGYSDLQKGLANDNDDSTSFYAPTSDSTGDAASVDVTVASMNAYVMDNATLSAGTLTVEWTADGYNYYINGMANADYQTKSTSGTSGKINVKNFVIEDIERAD